MKARNRYFALFTLIFAGEMIFSLPFHIARFFRPTFLSAFNLSNTELGDIFAVYGVCAMLAYFPGGYIADRFSPRKLLVASLLLTSGGGLYLMTLPSPFGMKLLFAYWGVTTILLFWAAMVKAVRQIAGDDLQGRAFGVLDAGRGLVAALMASGLTWAISVFSLPDGVEVAAGQASVIVQKIIYFYVVSTALAAALLWFLAKYSLDVQNENELGRRERISFSFSDSKAELVMISVIVVCAYCGYKGIDNYGLYAVSVLGMSDIESAKFTSSLAYIRPVVALLAGVLADRLVASRTVLIGFVLMAVSYSILGILEPEKITHVVILLNIMISAVGVFAVRAVYFAMIKEANIPANMTGRAVGLISVIGFTPDIFFAPISGRILDMGTAVTGQQNYFLFLAVFSVIGMIATLCFKFLKNELMK